MKKIKVERAAIEIFGGCNYKCTMCPQSTGRGSSWTKKMPFDHFLKILNQLDGSPLIQLEGSGEAFLVKNLDQYVKECTNRGFKTFIKTNGSFSKDCLDKVLDAGLNYIRFSIIGFDRESYKKYMSVDNWDLILSNISYCQKVIKEKKLDCNISMYHLLTNELSNDEELKIYQNLASHLNIKSQVWKMHNWSGNIKISNRIVLKKRRTCGRPFSPTITIRAGGEPGRFGAVTPCTQTFGPPNEAKSVLGYSDTDSLYNIWNSEVYEQLRNNHRLEKFDDIDYCKNCDFLYDDPEVLIWTNDESMNNGKIQGTNIDLLKG